MTATFFPYLSGNFSIYTDGTIIASDEIKEILKKWGVTEEKLAMPLPEETKKYLACHRAKYDEINKSPIDTAS